VTVQSVDRALSILELLGEYPGGTGLISISKELNLPKSTTHRLIQSLIAKNFVIQDTGNDRYRLSMKFVTLSSGLIENLDIRRIARPFIEELATKVNEVIHLCILDGHEVVYIDKVESNRTMRMYSQIGKRALLHCTGVGKMIMSGMSNEEIKVIATSSQLPKFTPTTITTEVSLLKEIEEIRKSGYSLDREEHEEGIYCIAAPIYDYTNNIIAAFSISGPSERVKYDIESGNHIALIMETSNKISEMLGYKRS